MSISSTMWQREIKNRMYRVQLKDMEGKSNRNSEKGTKEMRGR
jgi:hypothetical protein